MQTSSEAGTSELDAYTQSLKTPPSRLWQSAREPGPALSFVNVSQNDGSRLQNPKRIRPTMNLDFKGDTQVAVVQGDRRVRLEAVAPGLFGADFVHVRDETQEGFLYLCPSLRGYLHMPQTTRPAFSTPQPKVSLQRAGTATVAGRNCQEVLVTAFAEEVIAWRLWLCGDPDLRPFASPVGRLLTGPIPQAAGVLQQFGIPLKAEIAVGDSASQPTPASRFELQQLALRTATDGEFNIPEGYKDLRSQPATKAG